jgi:hypothetical protein
MLSIRSAADLLPFRERTVVVTGIRPSSVEG